MAQPSSVNNETGSLISENRNLMERDIELGPPEPLKPNQKQSGALKATYKGAV